MLARSPIALALLFNQSKWLEYSLLPYAIDAAVASLRLPGDAGYYLFPAKFGAFGLLMAAFLIFEPQGLVGMWRRVRNWVFLWPFRHRPLRAGA